MLDNLFFNRNSVIKKEVNATRLTGQKNIPVYKYKNNWGYK